MTSVTYNGILFFRPRGVDALVDLVPVDELLPDAARLPSEDEAGLHGEVHVGDVGEGDGEEGALGDGLGRVLEVARQVRPCHDPRHGGEEDAEALHEAGVLGDGGGLVDGVDVVGGGVEAPAGVPEGLPLILVHLFKM